MCRVINLTKILVLTILLHTIHCQNKGSKGEKGEQGKVGLPGRIGMPGRDGVPGMIGMPGIPGPMGPPGLSGIRGKDGLRGKRGNRGAAGDVGDRGTHGLQGIRGRSAIDCDCRQTMKKMQTEAESMELDNVYPDSFWFLYSILLVGILVSCLLSLQVIWNDYKMFVPLRDTSKYQ